MEAPRILKGYVAGLRKRRQVAGREEIRACDAERRAEFGRTLRAVRQLLQQIIRHLVAAALQQMWNTVGQGLLEPGQFPPPRLLLPVYV